MTTRGIITMVDVVSVVTLGGPDEPEAGQPKCAPYSRPRRSRVRAPFDHDAQVSALRDWESEGGHLLARDSWTSAVALADRPASTDKSDAR